MSSDVSVVVLCADVAVAVATTAAADDGDNGADGGRRERSGGGGGGGAALALSLGFDDASKSMMLSPVCVRYASSMNGVNCSCSLSCDDTGLLWSSSVA